MRVGFSSAVDTQRELLEHLTLFLSAKLETLDDLVAFPV